MKNSIYLFLLLVFASCVEQEAEYTPSGTPSDIAESELYLILKENYFWNQELPYIIDPAAFSSPDDLMVYCRNKQYDRWSYVQSREEFNNFFEEGMYVGFGVQFSEDASGNLLILFSFDGSPMRKAGIDRGCKIIKIDGVALSNTADKLSLLGDDNLGVSKEFTYIDVLGDTLVKNVIKENVTIKTVIHSEVIQAGSKKVGYLVLHSFIGPTYNELYQVFSNFQSQGINDLVLDFRYNGGGRVDVAQFLLNSLAPSITNGKICMNYKHNSNLANENYTYNFTTTAYNLGITRLFVIATRNTASASELIINSMKPYMPVYIIGDTTHGKPVGMYVFEFSDYAFVPISFAITNANNEGGYFNGIPPTKFAYDDVYRPFGDSAEDCLQQSLNYIRYNSWLTIKSSTPRIKNFRDRLSGFEFDKGAE